MRVAIILAVSLLLGQRFSLAAPGDLVLEIHDPSTVIGRTWFGENVHVSGDSIFISAITDDDAGVVYEYSPSNATFVRTLDNPNPVSYRRFGSNMLVVDSELIVSTWSMGTDVGIFGFDRDTGEHLRTISNPNPIVSNGVWQAAMAELNGDLIVGYFDRSEIHRVSLESGDVVANYINPLPTKDGFGVDVVTTPAGNVIVGAHFYDDGHGIAHVFDGATGAFLYSIQNPAPKTGEGARFGRNIEMVGDFIAIGAILHEIAGVRVGAVHLFNSADGEFAATILHPSPKGTGFFGDAFTQVGNSLAVVDSLDNAVLMFDPSTQELLATLPIPPTEIRLLGDSFLAGLGQDVVIGSKFDRTVYVIEGVPEPDSALHCYFIAFAAIAGFRTRRTRQSRTV